MAYKLILCTYLNIICRLYLSIKHVIFFHTHKSCIRFSFGITDAIRKDFQMMLILFKYRQQFVFKCINCFLFVFAPVLTINLSNTLFISSLINGLGGSSSGLFSCAMPSSTIPSIYVFSPLVFLCIFQWTYARQRCNDQILIKFWCRQCRRLQDLSIPFQ